MAIEDAIGGLIGDLLTPVVNSTLKSMGYSELESEKIQTIFMWFFIFVFCGALIGLTVYYS
jgi:hypothetical protein